MANQSRCRVRRCGGLTNAKLNDSRRGRAPTSCRVESAACGVRDGGDDDPVWGCGGDVWFAGVERDELDERPLADGLEAGGRDGGLGVFWWCRRIATDRVRKSMARQVLLSYRVHLVKGFHISPTSHPLSRQMRKMSSLVLSGCSGRKVGVGRRTGDRSTRGRDALGLVCPFIRQAQASKSSYRINLTRVLTLAHSFRILCTFSSHHHSESPSKDFLIELGDF